MIRSENLSISFGKRILLEKESFTMQRGEKIGLAGRNGSGKSTLLSLIAGEREPDSGKIIIPKNYTVAYMKQKLSFTHDNLIDECASCLPEDCRHEEYQAKKILSGLGFYDSDFLRSPAEFSGGFQVRIELAKAL
ncbi:MAG TPA: ABC transporter ATP-binding protein, partial [Spirochaetia bacterium]|nr:ABC transporter ATP-binding protein [Spirochaetia bacterium]